MSLPRNIQIIQLTAQDAGRWQQFRLAALQQAPDIFGMLYEEEKQKSLEQVTITLTQDACYAAVTHGGQIIAGAAYYVNPLQKLRHKAHVYGVYVYPEWRRQGIMRQLLQRMLADDSEKTFCTSIIADNTDATRCFASLSFIPYGTENDALRWQGKSYVLVHLQRRPVPEME